MSIISTHVRARAYMQWIRVLELDVAEEQKTTSLDLLSRVRNLWKVHSTARGIFCGGAGVGTLLLITIVSCAAGGANTWTSTRSYVVPQDKPTAAEVKKVP